jgi:hypothetical protein
MSSLPWQGLNELFIMYAAKETMTAGFITKDNGCGRL